MTTFKELDLSSFENSNNNGFELIKNDKLLNGGLSLDKINEDFEGIHKAISYTPVVGKYPILKKVPFLSKILDKDIGVQLKGFEGKLSSIFIAYDENYNSLISSGELYSEHIGTLSNKIFILQEHLKDIELSTDDNKLYYNSVCTLISALTGTLTRMKINLDTAEQIRIQMKLNKPIFKTIIDSLVIEKAGEIGLKAAQGSIDTMNKFICSTSIELTTSTINFSKEINKNKFDSTSADTFKNNMELLHVAMEEIVQIKKKALADFNTKHKTLGIA